MSDYGFATYDEKTGKIAEKINSKYPIFGPEYSKIATQYRTTALHDTSVNKVRNAVLSVPSADTPIEWDYETNSGVLEGFAQTEGVIEIEVASYEHNMGKRPFGYYYISGNYNKNYRYILNQVQTVGGSSVGGTFNVPYSGDGVLNIAGYVYPKISGIDLGGSINDSSYANLDITLSSVKILKQSEASGKKVIVIPNSCIGQFNRQVYNVQAARYDDPMEPLPNDPYYVAIDDERVHIYRRVFWIENIRREKIYVSGSVTSDVYQRLRAIEDYAGTSLDITVYLVPYNLEDLG